VDILAIRRLHTFGKASILETENKFQTKEFEPTGCNKFAMFGVFDKAHVANPLGRLGHFRSRKIKASPFPEDSPSKGKSQQALALVRPLHHSPRRLAKVAFQQLPC
jgi:hypothetical protein